MKDVVIFNGNDGQTPQAKMFIETLRDPEKGNYEGDIVIISTELSTDYVAWYESQGVIVFQRRITEVLDEWKEWLNVAVFEHIRMNSPLKYGGVKGYLMSLISEANDSRVGRRYSLYRMLFKLYTNLKPRWRGQMREEFDLWHRKHMSKLNVIPFLQANDKRWDRVMLCDADMVFQKPVSQLFDAVEPRKICVAEEIEPMIPLKEGGSPVYGSNAIVRKRYSEWHDLVQMGTNARHEVNVGVFLGDFNTVLETAIEWRTLMLESNYQSLFYCHVTDFLHEQDFFRLLRDKDKEKFKDLGLDNIYHGCNAAIEDISCVDQVFVRKSNDATPVIMHFAGGVWQNFSHVKNSYDMPASEVISQ